MKVFSTGSGNMKWRFPDDDRESGLERRAAYGAKAWFKSPNFIATVCVTALCGLVQYWGF